MGLIKIPKPWEIVDRDVTPESVYMNRRSVLKGMGVLGLYAITHTVGCSPNSGAGNRVSEDPLSPAEKAVYPAKRNPRFTLDRRLTAEAIAARFNNFYEFTDIKKDVEVHARALKTRPWTLEVSGHVQNPRTFDIDQLLKTMPLEERLYRLRCVEAWAMAVPWTGFPLKKLLEQVQPLSKATHVRFTSFYKPFTAQGQLAFWNPWPYAEGLTLKEAQNDLTFLATGIYGHPLPRQHGAPIRLAVPWKYGFKSIKSIVKIELLDYRPATFWNTVQGLEYDFLANVNPKIPHPRWSQAKEKMIGSGEIFPTQLFNGYGEWVNSLYA